MNIYLYVKENYSRYSTAVILISTKIVSEKILNGKINF